MIQRAALILVATFFFACSQPASNLLEPMDFDNQLKAESQAALIDVRTAGEFAGQHIPGAQNIDVNSSGFIEAFAGVDKATPIYFYCTTGVRSKEAATKLEEAGFTQLNELQGGITAWNGSGLAVEAAPLPPKAITYTNAQYDSLTSSPDLVLVDFMADWCGPCKAMAPHIDKLKKELDGQLTILKINTDFNQELGRRFEIMSIPHIKIYAKGELVYDEMGYKDEQQLRAALASYL